MNGVRRFLSGGTTSASSPPSSQTVPLPPTASSPPAFTNPLNVPPKPTWPPTSSPPLANETGIALEGSPRTTTAALFFRKDRQRAPASGSRSDEDTGNSSFQSRSSRDWDSVESGRTSTQPSSPVAGPSSPRKPVGEGEEMRVNGAFSSRDELLMSLLASEAVVDSRGYEVLGVEEVEELKKEYHVLSSQLLSLKKKLTLETKMRDAAQSLSKANASYRAVNQQTSEQLENANRKVEASQKELWRVSEKASEVYRKLLEHRAGVLGYSVRSMEKSMAPPDVVNGAASGYSTPNRKSALSPTRSSVTSARSNSSRPRFDGAHFFAGHSNAIVPALPSSRPPPASSAELEALQEELRAAQEALDQATVQQQRMSKELSSVHAERQVLEASKNTELRRAEEMIEALERQMEEMRGVSDMASALEDEKRTWAEERVELEERRQEVDTLQQRLEVLEEQGGVMVEMQTLLARERVNVAEKDREIAELKAERAMLLTERAALETAGQNKDQLEEGVDALQELMRKHGVSHYSRDASVRGLATSIEQHLGELKVNIDSNAQAQEEWNVVRAKLEDDVRAGMDRREVLNEQLDEARRERDAARADTRALDARLLEIQESGNGPIVEYTGDAAKIKSVLEPLWVILPSAEARAQRLGGGVSGRNKAALASPTTSSPGKNNASLSEMDVRSLKTLYDPNAFPLSARPSGPDAFTVEAFATRVQALIVDDRALIERLIRFAQAHDLLKKNAERAQKLAQESNVALETYQKQVKLLEDRNVSMIAKQTALHDEVSTLQEAVERITAEKLELENQAAEQAETCHQLTEANNSLSARVLKLAEESNTASNSDIVRKKLETELAACKSALDRAQEEIDTVRMSQQTQQMAILDELNAVQTENSNLRAQLRTKK